jgi:hypothetical protein
MNKNMHSSGHIQFVHSVINTLTLQSASFHKVFPIKTLSFFLALAMFKLRTLRWSSAVFLHCVVSFVCSGNSQNCSTFISSESEVVHVYAEVAEDLDRQYIPEKCQSKQSLLHSVKTQQRPSFEQEPFSKAELM